MTPLYKEKEEPPQGAPQLMQKAHGPSLRGGPEKEMSGLTTIRGHGLRSSTIGDLRGRTSDSHGQAKTGQLVEVLRRRQQLPKEVTLIAGDPHWEEQSERGPSRNSRVTLCIGGAGSERPWQVPMHSFTYRK